MNVYLLAPLVQTLLCLALLGVVLKGNFRSTTHRLFALFLLGLAVWGIVIFSMRSSPDLERALFWEKWLPTLAMLTSVVFYHFAIRYNGVRTTRWFIPCLYLLCVIYAPLAATDLLFKGMQLKPYGYAPIFGPVAPVHIAFAYILPIMALVTFIRNYRTSSSAEHRNRSLYIIIGISIALAGGAFDILPVLGLPVNPGYVIGTIFFCLLTTLAIVKYNLLDIRVVLRKSVAYTLSSAMVASPLIGFYLLFTTFIRGWTIPAWIYLILLLIGAFILAQLWGRVQQWVDRWFYRERYDYLKALETFVQNTQSLADSTKLGFVMVELIAKALRLSRVYLLQPQSPNGDFTMAASIGENSPTTDIVFSASSPLIKWLTLSNGMLYCQELDSIPQLQGVIVKDQETLRQMGAELIIPLKTHSGQLTGLLVLGQKLSEQPYSIEDRQLIYTLSTHMATNMENAQLYTTSQREVAERKQAEEAFKASEQRYRELADSLPQTVFEIDEKSNIIFSNREGFQAFGYTQEELDIGLNAFQMFIPEERDSIVENIQRIFDGEELGGLEYTALRKNGSTFPVLIYAAAIILENKPVGLRGIIIDITERKQAEEKEKQLQQELDLSSRLATVGEMASGIAHEINNPLTGVLGYSELLMQKDIPENAKRDISLIYEGAQRVADITRRMLTYARQYKPERVFVSINDIIEATLTMRRYELESSNISLTIQLDPDLPHTIGDTGQLQQVFLNIILNAELEMIVAHSGGNLLVKTERIDSTIRVSFSDDGPGIPTEDLDKIFNPFFTTREVGKGAGLGLSVSYGIVQQHGGRIYAKNRLGNGAIFFVELPIVTKVEQLTSVDPTAIEPKTASRAKVLVVDDEVLVQQFLTDVLSKEGHEAEVVNNGDDALKKLSNENYDLILLDIKLPGLNGIELYKHLQKKSESLAKKVVFITGDAMSSNTMVFILSTEVPYIMKPFDSEQLKASINRVLAEGVQRSTV